MSAFSSYITCGKTATTVTWGQHLTKCCHGIVTQQKLIAEQFAPDFRNLHLQPKERIKWTAISWLHDTKTVNWPLCSVCHTGKKNCHLQKFTQLTGIQLQILRFLEIFASQFQFPGEGQMPVLPPPCGRPLAGVTKNWAGGVALSHATRHDSRILKPELISAAAWRQ